MNQAYIDSGKARTDTATALEADNAANREVRRLAKEQMVMEAKDLPIGSNNARGGSQSAKSRGGRGSFEPRVAIKGIEHSDVLTH